jgi:chromosome segregation and condensation protein ScpB
LYATTKHFLNDFALKSLSELPELNSSLTKELSDLKVDENREEIQEN